jgi:hypothetical protein
MVRSPDSGCEPRWGFAARPREFGIHAEQEEDAVTKPTDDVPERYANVVLRIEQAEKAIMQKKKFRFCPDQQKQEEKTTSQEQKGTSQRRPREASSGQDPGK